jgi:hypothetical protein
MWLQRGFEQDWFGGIKKLDIVPAKDAGDKKYQIQICARDVRVWRVKVER